MAADPGVTVLAAHIKRCPTLEQHTAPNATQKVGLGYYKLFVDGAKVSTHELGAFTTYTKRVYYETIDATAAMRETVGNAHVIGVSIGDCWYAQSSVKVGQNTLILQASVLYTDGTTQLIASDPDGWEVSASPVLSGDIYKGETYNASRETPGWTTPGYTGGAMWTKVQ